MTGVPENIYFSLTLKNKMLSSQCNLIALIQQVQDNLVYSALINNIKIISIDV